MRNDQTNQSAGEGGVRPGGRRSRLTRVLLLSGVGVAGLLAVGAALHAGERSGGGLHEARFGGWDHGRGHGVMTGRLCSEGRGAWLDERIDLVESFVEFTAEQRPAWTALTEAARAGEARIGQACKELDEAADGPVGRLARAETMLGAGLDVVRTVRPAFEDFYAVLEPEQRAALDRLIERRHGRD